MCVILHTVHAFYFLEEIGLTDHELCPGKIFLLLQKIFYPKGTRFVFLNTSSLRRNSARRGGCGGYFVPVPFFHQFLYMSNAALHPGMI